MTTKKIYTAENIFTGSETLKNHCIVLNDEIIEDIFPLSTSNANNEIIDFKNATIAPAFIDIQLYGAHKRLLAVYPDAATVSAIYDYCFAGGAAYCIPTVATNTYDVIFKCIDAIKDYWKQNGKGVLGLHVEGPWINPKKRGAHKEEWIFSPTIEQAKELLEYGKDVIKIITLAPEYCPQEVIDLIQSYNIIVSAGHTNATYDEATNAFNNGIKTATHLYNAMSALQHREPGMVGAIFNHPSVMCSIVPDGHHVDFAAIKIAKKIMGNRLFAITDAVTETTEGYYQHKFEGDKYTSNGILSGSALTMHKCFLNFVNHCNININEALRMCSTYAANVIKMENKIGALKKDYAAHFVVLDENLELVTTV